MAQDGAREIREHNGVEINTNWTRLMTRVNMLANSLQDPRLLAYRLQCSAYRP